MISLRMTVTYFAAYTVGLVVLTVVGAATVLWSMSEQDDEVGA